MYETEPKTEERTFSELRRKIRRSELLSAATEKLLRNLRFSGRLCVVVKNGDILKSGYEEGYFSRRQEERLVP
jgi:sulfur carrier protein ThiS